MAGATHAETSFWHKPAGAVRSCCHNRNTWQGAQNQMFVRLWQGKNGLRCNHSLSFSSDKHRIADSRIRRKNTAHPRRESSPWSSPRFSAAGMVRMKNHKKKGWSTWFEIQAKSSLLGAEKLQGEHELSFRTSRRRFPRTEKDDETSIAAYKLQLTPPAGTEAPPAGTEGFSSKLFNLASSSLGGFRQMNPRWKAWNPSNTTAPFLFPCRQGNEQ